MLLIFSITIVVLSLSPEITFPVRTRHDQTTSHLPKKVLRQGVKLVLLFVWFSHLLAVTKSNLPSCLRSGENHFHYYNSSLFLISFIYGGFNAHVGRILYRSHCFICDLTFWMIRELQLAKSALTKPVFIQFVLNSIIYYNLLTLKLETL